MRSARPEITNTTHVRPRPALALGLKAIVLCLSASSVQAQLFWRTDGTSGTWTGGNWSATPTATGGSSWASGSDAAFNANSTVTFATTTVGNVTVADGVTVTATAGGTLSTGSASARIFDIGTGSTLTWTGQTVGTTANNAGFIKSGAGTWNIGAQSNAYHASNSGFTLNAGTVIVSGNNSFGGSSSVLTINGGVIQSSGTRAYANSSIVVGGNFENTGTGTATFSGTVALGSATRTITNNITSGSRIYSGVISGASGAGLTFAGSGAGETAITNTANTFTGDININGAEVRFTADGSMGDPANDIIIDGGRFSKASDVNTVTLGAGRTISVGDAAGTGISSPGTGILVYNGAIADKPGETGSWAKQGGGTLQLGGVSTFTGALSINNGTVQLTTGNDRLPTGTTVSLGQAASGNLGTFNLNGLNQQIAGLNSTTGTNATASNNTVTSASAAILTLGGSGTYSYGDGSNGNSGVISGAISVVKSGSGTQTFGDANTYTGTTTISGGTLALGASGALASPTISVASGGWFDVTAKTGFSLGTGQRLGGLGTILGNLEFGSGSTLAFDATGPMLIGSGTLSFAFGFGIDDLVGLSNATPEATYTVFSQTTGGSIDVANLANLGAGAAYDLGGKSAYFTTGAGSLSVIVVPETSTLGLAAAGLVLAGLCVRKRPRRS